MKNNFHFSKQLLFLLILLSNSPSMIAQDAMHINKNGYVGIGTISPKTNLDVAGTVIISDGLYAKNCSLSNTLIVDYLTVHKSLDVAQSISAKNGNVVNLNAVNFNAVNFTAGGIIAGRLSNNAALMVESGPDEYIITGSYFTDTNSKFNTANSSSSQTASRNLSIWAQNEIVSTGFYIQSDHRIKKGIKASSPTENLQFINNLRLVDYQFVDRIEHGNTVKSGFIAQEVEKLDKHLINKTTNYIPDIYSQAQGFDYDPVTKSLRLTLSDPHNCVAGDKIRIITEKKKMELVVKEINSNREMVLEGCDENVNKVFVYGKQVQDFRALDYEGIFCKSVGAIQMLSKQVEELQEENEQKDAEIAQLKTQLEKQQEIINNRLAKIEAALLK